MRIGRLHTVRGIGGGWLFLGVAAAVCATAQVVLRQPTHQGTLELAVTLDLTLVVPSLYWYLLVHRNGWPLLSVLPVFLATLLLASLILPADRQAALHVMSYLAVPVELALVVLLVHRAGRAVRVGRTASGTDTYERVRSAAYELVRNRRVADVLAFELGILWYAFLSWRTRSAPAAGGARPFTHHQNAGYGAVVAVILIALAVEITPIHALIGRWSATAAWVVTGLSLYTAVWLMGDFRAIRLQSTVLDGDRLFVRLGIRWRMMVPRERIEAVRLIGGRVSEEPVDLRVALPGSRRLRLRLDSPVEAVGPWGIKRRVRVFELGLDDPEGLQEALGNQA
jgi:hypothetical protein